MGRVLPSSPIRVPCLPTRPGRRGLQGKESYPHPLSSRLGTGLLPWTLSPLSPRLPATSPGRPASSSSGPGCTFLLAPSCDGLWLPLQTVPALLAMVVQSPKPQCCAFSTLKSAGARAERRMLHLYLPVLSSARNPHLGHVSSKARPGGSGLLPSAFGLL